VSDIEAGSLHSGFADGGSLLPSVVTPEPSLYTRLDSEDRAAHPNQDAPRQSEIEIRETGTSFGPAKRKYVEDGGGVQMTSNVGTVAWAAPEIFAGENIASYSLACDAYSFGMVMYELAERRAPFDHLNSRFDIMDVVLQGGRPEILSTLLLEDQPAYRALMERCWSQRPDMRPTFFEIVESLEEMYAAERASNKQIEAEARRASQEHQRTLSNGPKRVLFNMPGTPLLAAADDEKGDSDESDQTKPAVGRFGFRLGLFPKKGSRDNLLSPRSRSSF
jgi:serine/threonine protein kinase